jgi:hypothetical protein
MPTHRPRVSRSRAGAPPRVADDRRATSPRLGRLEVREDDEGVKLMAHGTLYAVLPPTPRRTPPPWLALAAAPWMVDDPPDGPIGLLGYGGGTVSRLLRAADRQVPLLGVDFDADVLRLGRRHLRSTVSGLRVDQADARDWLRAPGPRFRALLDDLYAPKDGWLARPHELEVIPGLARRRLLPGGVYAVNLRCPPGREEKQILARIRQTFREVRVVYTLEYAHKVVVATDRTIRTGALGRALARLLEPGPRRGSFPAGAGSCNPRTLGFRTMLRLPRGSDRHTTSR